MNEPFVFNESEYLNYIDEVLEDMHNIYDGHVFILEDLLKDKKIFKKIYKEMYTFMKKGFEVAEVRKFPVYYMISKEDKDVYTMEIRHMITNMIFWRTFLDLDDEYTLSKDDIIDAYNVSNKMIKKFIDEKVIGPFLFKVEIKYLNKAIHDLLYRLTKIGNDFNEIMAMGLNLESFIDVANRNPRFNEIIRTRVDENGQPYEIEQYLDELMREEIEILKTEDNCLKPILIAGAGIKEQQLREMTINGGFKPDLSGNTVPIPINSNLLVGGFRNITNYYLDATGGRKALIANATVMGLAGHFAQLVKLLTTDIKLADMDDCGTVHGVELTVTSKKYLQRLHGRYYRERYDRKYKLLQGNEEWLIGQKIIVRDPTKCSAGHNRICKKCYGELLYKVNKDISVGGYAATKITRPVSQNVLSTKHLLLTISEQIMFDDTFEKFFTLSANQIMLNNNSDLNLDDYRILINKTHLMTLENFEEDDYNAYTYSFIIQHKKKKEEMYLINELQKKEMFLTPEFYKLLKTKKEGNKYAINISDLNDDTPLFIIQINNRELTKPLYSIMHLLDTNNRGIADDEPPIVTIDQLVQRFNELLLEANIDVNFIHASVLLYPLIRKIDNVLERPDFRKYDVEYRMLTIKSALEKHPSITVSLSYQQLKRQLTTIDTYLKTAPSYLDDFFKKQI
jgi:hypothetical protein